MNYKPALNNKIFDIISSCADELHLECYVIGGYVRDYILNNNKELKKLKRGSKDFIKELDLEKSKMNIQRFKGLGEMNPEELWSTTLDPETRNLLQVQYSKDLKKDQSLIHTLMGNDVALRKDFIISNAINVQNLDI